MFALSASVYDFVIGKLVSQRFQWFEGLIPTLAMMKAVRQTSRATVAPSEGEASKNVMMEPQWSFVIWN